MSIKDLFQNSKTKQILKVKTLESASAEIEGVDYLKNKSKKKEEFVPPIDFSVASNFAKFGSAEMYYQYAFERIQQQYPYDGRKAEIQEFENESTYLDRYIFDNIYPRFNGFINLSPNGLSGGTPDTNGYYSGSTNKEYIYVLGGPHTASGGMTGKKLHNTFDKSTLYDPDNRRTNNLEFDFDSGNTIEFWMKKTSFVPSEAHKEVIFDVTNQIDSRVTLILSASSDPVNLLLTSGSTVSTTSIASSDFTTASIADDNWHHYAVSMKTSSSGILCRFFVDSQLENETYITDSPINEVKPKEKGVIASIGAKVTSSLGDGQIFSASFDEFRFWKKERSGKQIGQNWFTHVGGGTDDSIDNVDLGIYFKFNEGIVGSTVDETVIDYSGRLSNGSFIGYSTSYSRNTGSAIVLAGAATKEFKDPTIYSTHPDYISKLAEYKLSGSIQDDENSGLMINHFPSWLVDEDGQNGEGVKKLVQIMASYFDTLYAQVSYLNKIKNRKYFGPTIKKDNFTLEHTTFGSDSDKPYPFSQNLLRNKGFVLPNLFVEANIVEEFLEHDKNEIYDKDIEQIRDLIYQNIYNNLEDIYKSKGTRKSFKRLLKNFGINEDLIRLNLYADQSTYLLRDNYDLRTDKSKAINNNHTDNFGGTVVQSASSDSTGYIKTVSDDQKYGAFTLEGQFLIPSKPDPDSEYYFITNFYTSSLMGFHRIDESTPNTFHSDDKFLVVKLASTKNREHSRFVLSGSDGIYLTSSVIPNLYDNQLWTIGVKVKNSKYPQTNIAGATTEDVDIEFYGVTSENAIKHSSFSVSSESITSGSHYLSSSKKVFIGAEKENFTGSLITYSDIETMNVRFWLSELSNEELDSHSYYGNSYTSNNVLDNDSPTLLNSNVPKLETLALHWNFSQNTGSDSNGSFLVIDESSGSTDQAGSYGWVSQITKNRHDGRGYDYDATDNNNTIDFIYFSDAKRIKPDAISLANSVTIKDFDETVVFQDDEVADNFYSFEKSMQAVISDEMLNMFATVKDFNKLIGDMKEKYRTEYKDLKFLKRKFFEKIENEPDQERFFEFYKWIDSSISFAIRQLYPASARFSEGILDVVESHVLERNKYQQKFPMLSDEVIKQGTILGAEEMAYNWRLGHSPEYDSTKNQELEHCTWQKERREDTDGSDEEALRIVVNTKVYLPKLILKTDADVHYSRQDDIRRFRPRPYVEKYDLKPTIHGGTNYQIAKNRDIHKDYIRVHGESNTNGIPQNVFVIGVGEGQGLVPDQYCKKEANPNQKVKFSFKGIVGKNSNNDGTGVLDDEYSYTQQVKGQQQFPFNLVSESVDTGYNQIIYNTYTQNAVLTNLHADTTYLSNDEPMQGPFTRRHVGGHQSRHTKINKYNSALTTTNKIDDQYVRPESFRILIGDHPDASVKDGALGMVGPDYGGPYPDPTRQWSIYYRDERAKRPINIKNIQHDSDSSVVGNYRNNYEVISSFGRKGRNLRFNSLQDNVDFVETTLFNQLAGTNVNAGLFAQKASNNGSVFLNGTNDPNFFREATRRHDNPVESSHEDNKTTKSIITTKFSAPGGPEVMTPIFLDAIDQELSPYNSMNYRNSAVRFSGSGEVGSVRVDSHLGKREGLLTNLRRHTGQFGVDSVHGAGTIVKEGYSTVPGLHKQHRNNRFKPKNYEFYTGALASGSFQVQGMSFSGSYATASFVVTGATVYGLEATGAFNMSGAYYGGQQASASFKVIGRNVQGTIPSDGTNYTHALMNGSGAIYPGSETTASFTFSDNEFIAGTAASGSFTLPAPTTVGTVAQAGFTLPQRFIPGVYASASFEVGGRTINASAASGSFTVLKRNIPAAYPTASFDISPVPRYGDRAAIGIRSLIDVSTLNYNSSYDDKYFVVNTDNYNDRTVKILTIAPFSQNVANESSIITWEYRNYLESNNKTFSSNALESSSQKVYNDGSTRGSTGGQNSGLLISFWFRFDEQARFSTAGSSTILKVNDSNGNASFWIELVRTTVGSDLRFDLKATRYWDYSSSSTSERKVTTIWTSFFDDDEQGDGNWHHIVLNYANFIWNDSNGVSPPSDNGANVPNGTNPLNLDSDQQNANDLKNTYSAHDGNSTSRGGMGWNLWVNGQHSTSGRLNDDLTSAPLYSDAGGTISAPRGIASINAIGEGSFYFDIDELILIRSAYSLYRADNADDSTERFYGSTSWNNGTNSTLNWDPSVSGGQVVTNRLPTPQELFNAHSSDSSYGAWKDLSTLSGNKRVYIYAYYDFQIQSSGKIFEIDPDDGSYVDITSKYLTINSGTPTISTRNDGSPYNSIFVNLADQYFSNTNPKSNTDFLDDVIEGITTALGYTKHISATNYENDVVTAYSSSRGVDSGLAVSTGNLSSIFDFTVVKPYYAEKNGTIDFGQSVTIAGVTHTGIRHHSYLDEGDFYTFGSGSSQASVSSTDSHPYSTKGLRWQSETDGSTEDFGPILFNNDLRFGTGNSTIYEDEDVDLTLSFWARPDNSSATKYVVTLFDGAGDNTVTNSDYSILVYVSYSYMYIRCYTSSTDYKTFRISVDHNNYQHYCFVINRGAIDDNSQHKFYVNGEEVTPYVTTYGTVGTDSVRIQRIYVGDWPSNTSTLEYSGHLTQLSLWASYLGSADVQEIYNKGRWKDLLSHPDWESCVGWWELGDDTDLSSIDITGTGHPLDNNYSDSAETGIDDSTYTTITPAHNNFYRYGQFDLTISDDTNDHIHISHGIIKETANSVDGTRTDTYEFWTHVKEVIESESTISSATAETSGGSETESNINAATASGSIEASYYQQTNYTTAISETGDSFGSPLGFGGGTAGEGAQAGDTFTIGSTTFEITTGGAASGGNVAVAANYGTNADFWNNLTSKITSNTEFTTVDDGSGGESSESTTFSVTSSTSRGALDNNQLTDGSGGTFTLVNQSAGGVTGRYEGRTPTEDYLQIRDDYNSYWRYIRLYNGSSPGASSTTTRYVAADIWDNDSDFWAKIASEYALLTTLTYTLTNNDDGTFDLLAPSNGTAFNGKEVNHYGSADGFIASSDFAGGTADSGIDDNTSFTITADGDTYRVDFDHTDSTSIGASNATIKVSGSSITNTGIWDNVETALSNLASSNTGFTCTSNDDGTFTIVSDNTGSFTISLSANPNSVVSSYSQTAAGSSESGAPDGGTFTINGVTFEYDSGTPSGVGAGNVSITSNVSATSFQNNVVNAINGSSLSSDLTATNSGNDVTITADQVGTAYNYTITQNNASLTSLLGMAGGVDDSGLGVGYTQVLWIVKGDDFSTSISNTTTNSVKIEIKETGTTTTTNSSYSTNPVIINITDSDYTSKTNLYNKIVQAINNHSLINVTATANVGSSTITVVSNAKQGGNTEIIAEAGAGASSTAATGGASASGSVAGDSFTLNGIVFEITDGSPVASTDLTDNPFYIAATGSDEVFWDRIQYGINNHTGTFFSSSYSGTGVTRTFALTGSVTGSSNNGQPSATSGTSFQVTTTSSGGTDESGVRDGHTLDIRQFNGNPVESKIIIDIDQAQPYLKSSISYFISASTTNNTTFWNNILAAINENSTTMTASYTHSNNTASFTLLTKESTDIHNQSAGAATYAWLDLDNNDHTLTFPEINGDTTPGTDPHYFAGGINPSGSQPGDTIEIAGTTITLVSASAVGNQVKVVGRPDAELWEDLRSKINSNISNWTATTGSETGGLMPFEVSYYQTGSGNSPSISETGTSFSSIVNFDGANELGADDPHSIVIDSVIFEVSNEIPAGQQSGSSIMISASNFPGEISNVTFWNNMSSAMNTNLSNFDVTYYDNGNGTATFEVSASNTGSAFNVRITSQGQTFTSVPTFVTGGVDGFDGAEQGDTLKFFRKEAASELFIYAVDLNNSISDSGVQDSPNLSTISSSITADNYLSKNLEFWGVITQSISDNTIYDNISIKSLGLSAVISFTASVTGSLYNGCIFETGSTFTINTSSVTGGVTYEEIPGTNYQRIYDNAYVVTQLPATDFQYSWTNKALTNDYNPTGSNTTGSNTKVLRYADKTGLTRIGNSIFNSIGFPSSSIFTFN